jgi:hypothetical protein
VKRPGRESDHSPPSSVEVNERVELYFHSANTPSWRGDRLKNSTGTTSPLSYLYDFCLFPNIPALKGPIFLDTEDIQKNVTTALKVIQQQEVQNVSNSGNIVGPSAKLLKGSASKLTHLGKLSIYDVCCQ